MSSRRFRIPLAKTAAAFLILFVASYGCNAQGGLCSRLSADENDPYHMPSMDWCGDVEGVVLRGLYGRKYEEAYINSYQTFAEYHQKNLDKDKTFGTNGNVVKCYFAVAAWNADVDFRHVLGENCQTQHANSECFKCSNALLMLNVKLPEPYTIAGHPAVDIAVIWITPAHLSNFGSAAGKERLQELSGRIKNIMEEVHRSTAIEDRNKETIARASQERFMAQLGQNHRFRGAFFISTDVYVGAISAPHGGLIAAPLTVTRKSLNEGVGNINLFWHAILIPDVEASSGAAYGG